MATPTMPPVSVEQLQAMGRGNAVEHLGIVITKIGPDFLEGTMPVDHRTRQPYGVLHGGASVLLAETLGSIAGAIMAGARRMPRLHSMLLRLAVANIHRPGAGPCNKRPRLLLPRASDSGMLRFAGHILPENGLL